MIMRRPHHRSAHGRAQPVTVTPAAYDLVVTPRYSAEDLVGVHEIAQRLGVGTSVVHDWRRRHMAFPDPVLKLGMGFIWYWPEVRDWAAQTKRLH